MMRSLWLIFTGCAIGSAIVLGVYIVTDPSSKMTPERAQRAVLCTAGQGIIAALLCQCHEAEVI
jgi:hypothetical protein